MRFRAPCNPEDSVVFVSVHASGRLVVFNESEVFSGVQCLPAFSSWKLEPNRTHAIHVWRAPRGGHLHVHARVRRLTHNTRRSTSGDVRSLNTWTGLCSRTHSHLPNTSGNSPVICKTPEDPEDPSYGGQSAMIRDLTSTAHPLKNRSKISENGFPGQNFLACGALKK